MRQLLLCLLLCSLPAYGGIQYAPGITALTGDVTASGPGSAAAIVDATSAATASKIVKRDANGNAQFSGIGMTHVSAGIDNTGVGETSGSGSASYPVLIQRTLASPILTLISNPSTAAGAGVKLQQITDNGGSTFEQGLFTTATAAPDAYNGGRATSRCTDGCPGISFIADGSATGNLKFYAGGNGASDLQLTIAGASGLSVSKTITAGGTTGNQVINKIAGTVNIAAAGSAVTVTNSLVGTSSIVLCVIRTNDATATLKNVVPGSGSFVITLTAAATAEVSIGFVVVN